MLRLLGYPDQARREARDLVQFPEKLPANGFPIVILFRRAKRGVPESLLMCGPAAEELAL